MRRNHAKNPETVALDGAQEPGRKPRNTAKSGNRSSGKGPAESAGFTEPGIVGITPSPAGGVANPEGYTDQSGTEAGRSATTPDAWTDRTATTPGPPIGNPEPLQLETPSLSAILAPLKSPDTVGELAGILFDTIAKQRGPHWHVDRKDLTAAIGGPVCAWLENSERDLLRKAEAIAGPTAIGIGLLSVFLPIAIGEWALYQERKANAKPSPRVDPAPTSPSYARPATVPGSSYGVSLGFGTATPGADDPTRPKGAEEYAHGGTG